MTNFFLSSYTDSKSPSLTSFLINRSSSVAFHPHFSQLFLANFLHSRSRGGLLRFCLSTYLSHVDSPHGNILRTMNHQLGLLERSHDNRYPSSHLRIYIRFSLLRCRGQLRHCLTNCPFGCHHWQSKKCLVLTAYHSTSTPHILSRQAIA